MAANDQVIPAAFAVKSSPGNYALLLGSGISQAAGFKTGWGITDDLIRKIAKLSNEEITGDSEVWYETKFGNPPIFSDLFEKLPKSYSKVC